MEVFNTDVHTNAPPPPSLHRRPPRSLATLSFHLLSLHPLQISLSDTFSGP